MRKLVHVIVQPLGLRVDVHAEENLLRTLRQVGVWLPSTCGGTGSCGKCFVKIVDGVDGLSELTEAERKHLTRSNIGEEYRLACQAKLLGNVTVLIPPESMVGKPRTQVEGVEVKVTLNPAVTEHMVEVEAPTLKDLRADYTRLADALKETIGIERVAVDHYVMRLLPSSLRLYSWKPRVVLWSGGKVLDVTSRENLGKLYGIAVDIGTTKLATYLLNLSDGTTTASASMVNPQIQWGEDVISRISYARGIKETRQLQKVVVSGINQLIHECCLKAGIDPRYVYEIVAVGNTAMHHLFLGINPKSLGFTPYTPVVQEALNLEARSLGLKVNKAANVHVLPVVAGFVGADAIADILTTQVAEEDDWGIVFDIGTNTEVILGKKDKVYAGSCASGPAFEGARIKHGMRASSGAIEYVTIDSETLQVKFHVIDDEKPKGICGSGVIDTIAQLLKAGVIDASGKFRDGYGGVRLDVQGQREFIVADGEETASGRELTITQNDVREIQLAKAAVLTGAMILMREARVGMEEIGKIYLAGAFGTYVKPESAVAVGMIPPFTLDYINSVGNAAGTGARQALISLEARVKADKLARKVHYIEFHIFPDFQEWYLKALSFPEKGVNRSILV